MTCTATQTDINSASTAALSAALGVDSPVAQRVVGFRPYLAVKDLLVVQGIGADKLNQIVSGGHACAAIPSTPPPAPSPCATTDKVDLQSATADDIARVTGVNKNAAAAIVAARPFATLRHVTPERVPGVGKGTLDTVVGKSCLTPQPVTDNKATWRWAYPAYATTVTRDQYSLVVPAGVIDAASGAWTSVTPTSAPDVPILLPSDPAADLHIWGNWADGTDKVTVTLPPPSDLDQLPSDKSWTPLLKHIHDDGTGDTVLPTVDANTGLLSTQTTSLSKWSTFYALTDTVFGTFLSARFPAPSCSSPWTQQSGTSDYAAPNQPTHVVIKDSQLNLPGNHPTPVGFLIKHCVQAAPGPGTGTPPYVPARTVLLDNSGAVYTVRDGANNSTVSLDPVNTLTYFTNTATAITSLTAPSNAVLFAPGDRIAIDTPAGTHGDTLVQPSALLSIERGAIDALIGGAFSGLSSLDGNDQAKLLSQIGVIGGCVKDAIPTIQQSSAAAEAAAIAKALYSCVMTDNRLATLLDLAFQAVARADSHLTVAQADKLGKGLKGVEEANKFLALANFASNVIDIDTVELTKSDFGADHYRPAPAVDAEGRPVQAICVLNPDSVAPSVDEQCQADYYSALFSSPTGGGGDSGLLEGYINQDAQQHSWLITDPDTTIHDIANGNDYICLAQAGYPVRFDTGLSGLQGFTHSSDPAACSAPKKDITPQLMEANLVNAQGGDTNTIRLLRSASTGDVYLYKGHGQLSKVLGSDQLKCWATGTHKYMAYDYVTNADLAQFDYHPEYVDYCVS